MAHKKENKGPHADSEDLLRNLAQIDTPTLANAIEILNIRNRASGFCNRLMRQLTPEFGVMCGYAVTVQAVTMTPETTERNASVSNYLKLCRAIERSPKPAVVVFQETSGFPEYSAHIGEVLVSLFRHFGAIGVVSDSAVRDITEIRQLGFQLFAPGLVASHANIALEVINEPVTVCGMRVHPGDLLHGDENGLISVPAEGREALPELVGKVRAKESVLLDYLRKDPSAVTLEGIRDRLTH